MRQNNIPLYRQKGQFARSQEIAMVLARYRLEEVLRYAGLQKYIPFHWLIGGNPKEEYSI